MTKLANYLAKLIRAQLYNETVGELPEEISIEELVTIAKENHMVYMFLSPMLSLQISEEWLSIIKKSVLYSMSKTLMQVNELKKLVELFEKYEIVNQPMKGAVMKFIYPSPELREMSDIDFLVRDEDMGKAAGIMQECCYSFDKAIRHHDVYVKKPYMCVEVHRALYDKNVDKAQYEYFKDISKRQLREGYRYTYDFTKEDFYVYMLAHMAKHFYVKGCGIRNLVDIYVYNERFSQEMDWTYIEKQMEQCGILTFAKHMEHLAQAWINQESTEAFYDELFEYMMNSGIYGKEENELWYKFAAEDMNANPISKLKVKLWYIFPPLSYMKKHYPWLGEKPYLLIVAWIIRSFRAVFCGTGKVRNDKVNQISIDQIQLYQKIYRNMDLHFK